MCYSSTLDTVSKAVLVMHTAVSSTLSAQLHGLYIGSICIDNLVASLFIYLFIFCMLHPENGDRMCENGAKICAY